MTLMARTSSLWEQLARSLYPGPDSTVRQVIASMCWSGIVGIVMLIGLVIDRGWIGRIGAVIVLGGLVVPLWVRALKMIR
jgi:hypothetical protein